MTKRAGFHFTGGARNEALCWLEVMRVVCLKLLPDKVDVGPFSWPLGACR